jgi:hypothetical protein
MFEARAQKHLTYRSKPTASDKRGREEIKIKDFSNKKCNYSGSL